MKSILVTGASGFVGRYLCRKLIDEGWHVKGAIRAGKSLPFLDPSFEEVIVEPLGPDTPWVHALAGVETIIHLAARVHVMDDPLANPLAEFRKVNTEGTATLARQAAIAGVKRLVFASSIKVNGEESPVPFSEKSPVAPIDPYGVSKWEAELSLRKIEAEMGLDVVVVRPALVYGPGVKANFLNLMKIVHHRIPLPFASITNQRSFVFVGNLADALVKCAVHSAAAGQTYLVCDGEAVSTPVLIQRIAAALGKRAGLFPFPPLFLRLAARFLDECYRLLSFQLAKEQKSTGKFSASISRLTQSLVVDNSKICSELCWKPPYSMEEGLRETAKGL